MDPVSRPSWRETIAVLVVCSIALTMLVRADGSRERREAERAKVVAQQRVAEPAPAKVEVQRVSAPVQKAPAAQAPASAAASPAKLRAQQSSTMLAVVMAGLGVALLAAGAVLIRR